MDGRDIGWSTARSTPLPRSIPPSTTRTATSSASPSITSSSASRMTRRGSSRAGPLVLISQDQIVGRVWARYSPFWDRRLL